MAAMTATERQRRWRHRRRQEYCVVGVDFPVLDGGSALIARGYMAPLDAGDKNALRRALQRYVETELLELEPVRARDAQAHHGPVLSWRAARSCFSVPGPTAQVRGAPRFYRPCTPVGRPRVR